MTNTHDENGVTLSKRWFEACAILSRAYLVAPLASWDEREKRDDVWKWRKGERASAHPSAYGNHVDTMFSTLLSALCFGLRISSEDLDFLCLAFSCDCSWQQFCRAMYHPIRTDTPPELCGQTSVGGPRT